MSRRTASSIAASSLARLHILRNVPLVGTAAATTPVAQSLSSSLNHSNNEHKFSNYKITSHAFSTAAASSSSSSSSPSDYKSPFEEYFNFIQTNQNTLSGAAPPDVTPPEIPRLKCGVAEHDIKFKTTSYSRLMLPPYVHTNEYKVILEVNVNLLPLDTPLEHKIFHQIVGNRFNVEKNRLKLTCNLFASRIENKRHLCSMLDRIVLGAKRLAAEIRDSGEDDEEAKEEV